MKLLLWRLLCQVVVVVLVQEGKLLSRHFQAETCVVLFLQGQVLVVVLNQTLVKLLLRVPLPLLGCRVWVHLRIGLARRMHSMLL